MSCLLKVVEIHDVTPLRKRKIVEYRYHLLQVKADDGSDFAGSTNINLDSVADQSVAFLRAGHLVEIDSFLATHGPCGRLFGMHLAWSLVKYMCSFCFLEPALFLADLTVSLSHVILCVIIYLAVLIEHQIVTDRWRDTGPHYIPH